MDQETKERHRRELDEASSPSTNKVSASAGEDSATPNTSVDGGGGAGGAGDSGGGVGGVKGKVSEELEGMSAEDRERAKRDQKRAKAQRKREKQREKVRWGGVGCCALWCGALLCGAVGEGSRVGFPVLCSLPLFLHRTHPLSPEG